MDIIDTYDEDHRVRLDLVHIGVGQVSPSDIEIAETFKAIVYAFNIECPQNLADEAKAKNVSIRHHNVIYKLVDDIKEEVTARIPVRQEEELVGESFFVTLNFAFSAFCVSSRFVFWHLIQSSNI